MTGGRVHARQPLTVTVLVLVVESKGCGWKAMASASAYQVRVLSRSRCQARISSHWRRVRSFFDAQVEKSGAIRLAKSPAGDAEARSSS